MATEMVSRAGDISGVKLVFLGNAVGGYDFEDLLRCYAVILGVGNLGMCYKARLQFEDNHTLAVKRLRADRSAEMEFKEKVEELGKMDHENLLPIRAYCCFQDERVLVYDYIHKGSLAYLLHGKPFNFESTFFILYYAG